jgi:hypothetical protein
VIAGPEVNTVPATQEDNTHFNRSADAAPPESFAATDAKGQGMRSVAQFDQMSYGAKMGLSWSFEYRGRQMRVKPWVGWYHYKLGVEGIHGPPECNPTNRCTNTYFRRPKVRMKDRCRRSASAPSDGPQGKRQRQLRRCRPWGRSRMDTARYGPILTSLFIGFGGYYIPGDRDIDFHARKSYDDELGADTASPRGTRACHPGSTAEALGSASSGWEKATSLPCPQRCAEAASRVSPCCSDLRRVGRERTRLRARLGAPVRDPVRQQRLLRGARHSIFMFGLGLGAWLVAGFADRRFRADPISPLRWYAGFELAIAGLAALVALLMPHSARWSAEVASYQPGANGWFWLAPLDRSFAIGAAQSSSCPSRC